MNARKLRWGFVGLASAAFAGGACDWRQLDKAVENAPVRSVTEPDGFSGGSFGRVLLALTPPAGNPKVTARLLVAAPAGPSVSLLDYDAKGRVTLHSASTAQLADLTQGIKSAVEISPGKLLLGVPKDGNTATAVPGRVFYLNITDDAARGPQFEAVKLPMDIGGDARRNMGLGVATGSISGAADKPDLVVVSEDDLILLEDGDKPFSAKCGNLKLPGALADSFRAIVVGDFLQGPGNEGEEIALGMPQESKPGSVLIVSKAKGTLDCPVVITAPGGATGAAGFGTSLAVADLDGDGLKDDLVVGAPGERAYAYLGPLTGVLPPMASFQIPELSAGAATGAFGTRVGVVDIDAAAGPEVLVGAPGLSVAGHASAGEVFAFKPDGAFVAKVAQNDPEDTAGFGYSIVQLKFAAPACAGGAAAAERPLLVVGSSREIFTYFKLPVGPADPRCFSAK